jgi:hypothetical protein
MSISGDYSILNTDKDESCSSEGSRDIFLREKQHEAFETGDQEGARWLKERIPSRPLPRALDSQTITTELSSPYDVRTYLSAHSSFSQIDPSSRYRN